MAECSDGAWTISMSRNPEETPQKLVFELTVADGVISGQVSVVGAGVPFSEVTGTCESFDDPDVTLRTLSFKAGDVDIFMVGFTHRVDAFNRFEGRFSAIPRAGTEQPDPEQPDAEQPDAEQPGLEQSDTASADEPLLATAAFRAGPGDTGTGTGQQT